MTDVKSVFTLVFIGVFLGLAPYGNSQQISLNFPAQTFLVFGPTRYGKSKLINDLLGNDYARIGEENGQSTTKHPRLYTGKTPLGYYVNFVDSPGIYDNTGISEAQIKKEISDMIALKTNADSITILLVESLSESSIQIPNTLKRIIDIFGSNCISSIIIVVTKSDLVVSKLLESRQKNIIELAKKLGLPVVFTSNGELPRRDFQAILLSSQNIMSCPIEEVIRIRNENKAKAEQQDLENKVIDCIKYGRKNVTKTIPIEFIDSHIYLCFFTLLLSTK